MRTLTIVKDSDGKPKIAQFGSCCYQDDEQLLDEYESFFVSFIDDTKKVKLLQKKIESIKFFSEQEWIDFQKKLFKGNKTEVNYATTFLDESVGVYIIDKLNEFTEKTRLLSFNKYSNDFLFYDIKFEIDFNENCAKMTVNGSERINKKLQGKEEKNTNIKEHSFVKENKNKLW